MKYVELKASLKNDLKNCYLIAGEDRFLCFDALSKIVEASNITIPDMNEVQITGESTSARAIVDSANIYPFGDNYRLVIVKNYNPTKNKQEWGIIQTYLKSPMASTILIFFNPENADFFKSMSDITLVDCGKIDSKYVSAYIKNFLGKEGISASEEAVEKLILFTSGDMTRVNNELVKLSSYVSKTKELTTSIVEEFVVQDKEYQVFELAEFLAKGDAESAVDLVDSFMVKGSAFQVLTPLYNNFRRALFVSINKDKTPSELASLLGVKEFAVRMLSNQVKNFSPKKLKAIVDELAVVDQKIKIGEMKENIAIKTIIFNILNIRGL